MKVKFIKKLSNVEPSFLEKLEAKDFNNINKIMDYINKQFEGNFKIIDNKLIYTNKFSIINTYEIIS